MSKQRERFEALEDSIKVLIHNLEEERKVILEKEKEIERLLKFTNGTFQPKDEEEAEDFKQSVDVFNLEKPPHKPRPGVEVEINGDTWVLSHIKHYGSTPPEVHRCEGTTLGFQDMVCSQKDNRAMYIFILDDENTFIKTLVKFCPFCGEKAQPSQVDHSDGSRFEKKLL